MQGATNRIPLMFIHGAWLTSGSLGNLRGYFESRGYDVSAHEWPHKPAGVAAQRKDTVELEGLGLTEIVDHYESEIRALDEPPVLIGHSFGSPIVELLLDRGLGRAGVAMSPAPPKGNEKSEAQTDYVECPDRPHLMMVGQGWEDIAAGIQAWLERMLAAETGKGSTIALRTTEGGKRGLIRRPAGTAMITGCAAPIAGLTLAQVFRLAPARRPGPSA